MMNNLLDKNGEIHNKIPFNICARNTFLGKQYLNNNKPIFSYLQISCPPFDLLHPESNNVGTPERSEKESKNISKMHILIIYKQYKIMKTALSIAYIQFCKPI